MWFAITHRFAGSPSYPWVSVSPALMRRSMRALPACGAMASTSSTRSICGSNSSHVVRNSSPNSQFLHKNFDLHSVAKQIELWVIANFFTVRELSCDHLIWWQHQLPKRLVSANDAEICQCSEVCKWIPQHSAYPKNCQELQFQVPQC